LLIGKVLGDSGSGGDTGIAAGIDWAIAEGADIVSMSLGSSNPSPTINAAIKRGLDKGIIFCVAAGNSGPGPNTVDWPGAYSGVVCVAAIDKSLQVASFSSRGLPLIACTPGVQIVSCYPGDRLASLSGTSMATPYMAAVAACWVQDRKAKGLTHTCPDFIQALTATVRDLGPVGKDTAYGYGLAQIAKMVIGDPKLPPPDPMPSRITITRDDLTESGKKKYDLIGVDEISVVPTKQPSIKKE
jgi:subtilisin